MLVLRIDLKNRKRELAKIRWKYDPTGRRRSELVDRDVRQMNTWAQKVIDDYKREQAEKTAPVVKAEVSAANRRALQKRTDPAEQLVDLAASVLGEPTPVPLPPVKPVVRSLDGVSPGRIEMVGSDTGINDLATATDDEIIHAYISRTGITRDIAQQYLALLDPGIQA